MRLNLNYVHNATIGYGRLGTRLHQALVDMGVEVPNQQPLPGEDGEICATAAWISVPSHIRGWWEGQRPVIFTMFESTYLPESFRNTIDDLALVVVPSKQNVELFSEYHPNVKQVPLGIDPGWQFQQRREPGAFFSFLCGGSGVRKGTDLAAEAFRKAFPPNSWGSGPIPELVLKNPRGEDHLLGDRIRQITGKLSTEDEIALYASAHCYVQPSRGEGWGLQPLQAIGQGMPTILTDAHGHAEFSHLGFGIPAELEQSAYFIYGDAGLWWKPDVDVLVDRMRWVYDHYDEACDFARVASDEAHATYTWANTAAKFVDAIGPEHLTGYSGSRRWVEPRQRMYRVVTKRPMRCEIAGVTRIFEPGVSYWEPADVKRILFESGDLDPSCIRQRTTVDGHEVDDDPGLLPEQIERAKLQSAADARCPTCAQKLNTNPATVVP